MNILSGAVLESWFTPVRVGTRTGQRPWAIARRLPGNSGVEFHRQTLSVRAAIFRRGAVITFHHRDHAEARAGRLNQEQGLLPR